MLPLYREAKVYCQLSCREGLPNSLCEAMLCGCIPVGSNVGGIPHAIGDTGYLVDYGNDEQIIRSIEEALQASPSQGISARKRIATLFALATREKQIVRIIEEIGL